MLNVTGKRPKKYWTIFLKQIHFFMSENININCSLKSNQLNYKARGTRKRRSRNIKPGEQDKGEAEIQSQGNKTKGKQNLRVHFCRWLNCRGLCTGWFIQWSQILLLDPFKRSSFVSLTFTLSEVLCCYFYLHKCLFFFDVIKFAFYLFIYLFFISGTLLLFLFLFFF